jgi:D-glycero-alpha-D-manno-heptose-7-phosphate kinase
MIISRTPLRITLGGGGTDLPSFYSKHGGLVVSMAIDKYIYLTYKPDHFEKQLKLRYSQIEIVNDVSELKNHRAKEALLIHKINNSCEINSCADLPSNTGLGSSGSFLVGTLNCIREYKKLNREPHILAEEACDIEINRLKEPVGKQDQYIAAYGGIKILNIDTEGKVNVEDLKLNQSLINNFVSHLCVYYLNIKRDASEILSDQQKLKGNSEDILKIVKEHGLKTISYLREGDFISYGSLMDEYWQLKKQLSNKISVPIVDNIYEHTKKYFNVLGGKIIGAGGGGFLLLYCPNNQDKLDAFMNDNGFPRLHFGLDNHGSMILGNFTN